ncbi:unnamed protein product, partial [Clonostachys rhizophaga]
MALYLHGGRTSNTGADKFLAEHTEVSVGRDALNKAQAGVKGGNTFTVVNKPVSNMVMVQEFDADTNERLFVVALIDDQKAEEYYQEYNQDSGIGLKCGGAEDEGPNHFLFERASRCGQFCGRGDDCTVDQRCPACRYRETSSKARPTICCLISPGTYPWLDPNASRAAPENDLLALDEIKTWLFGWVK